MKNQKLELTWIGKDKRPRLEPRIFLEDKELSYQAQPATPTSIDLFSEQSEKPQAFNNNLLIHGDNLLALKALEQQYAGLVKCVYIDPPFNTGEAFENYDDGLEHSLWLTLMYQRLHILKQLLSDDGSIFIHIDDNELGYLLVLCDEIFGRKNRINTITFKQASATGHKSINPGLVTTTNYLILYAKSKEKWLPNRLFTSRERDSRYSQFIENYDLGYKSWTLTPLGDAFANSRGISSKELKKSLGDDYEEALNQFVIENAYKVVQPARPDYKSVGQNVKDAIDESKSRPNEVIYLERDGYEDMYFRNGQRWLFYKNKLKEIDGELVAGEPLTNLWGDILSNNIHKEGGISFPKGKKPEHLIKRILELCTSEGDLILDSFAGSGTTASVAHKMRRRWITIELGDQAYTHVLPRLKKVISGEDQDGVSKPLNWQGGGGFRYLRLAPSLLKKDSWGNWVINKEYNPEMLSAALCKHMGFTYAPSQMQFWNHGYSTENDFIYVTTGSLAYEQLKLISEEVGSNRTLLICCKAFITDGAEFPNLTIKKIPQAILNKCEWDHDDYSFTLNILPDAQDDEFDDELEDAE
ncbi:site-specific DNA-methyltransferase [Tolumonas auensis]|uniref:site-specific DNA-methyltransferase n=1 Tax=Tolumonas auensis TaxID=43948 RepID=UPI002AA8B4A8|nr:site-specific DNA-methyltransferase [Tolumonas auensis]